ncbi:MAG: autotransporter domain-containing protein [Proteobacteria bacterium]|nr:autotransporter domain-containing protein [Pseudomonadota bacterium]
MHHRFHLGYLRYFRHLLQLRRPSRQPFRPALRLATRLLFLMVSGLLVLLGLTLLTNPIAHAQTPEISIHLGGQSPAASRKLVEGQDRAITQTFHILADNDTLATSLPIRVRITHNGSAINSIDPDNASIIKPELFFISGRFDGGTSAAFPDGDSSSDYEVVLVPHSIIFPPNRYENQLRLLGDDVLDEETSVVTIEILPGDNYSVSPIANSITITLLDDDPLLSLTANTTRIEAGDEVMFTVTASKPTNDTIHLRYADANALIAGTPPATITLPQGQDSTSFTIATNAQQSSRGGTFTASVLTSSGLNDVDTPYGIATGAASVAVEVVAIPQLSIRFKDRLLDDGSRFVPPSRKFVEGRDRGNTVRFDIITSEYMRDEFLRIGVRITHNGTAINSGSRKPELTFLSNRSNAPVPEIFPDGNSFSDYVLVLPERTFNGPAIHENVVMLVVDDDRLDEDTSFITVELLPGDNHTVSPSERSVSFTVLDDDPNIELTMPNNVAPGEDIEVTISADRHTDDVIYLRYADPQGLVTSVLPDNVTFAPGETSTSFTVTTRNDTDAIGVFKGFVYFSTDLSAIDTPYGAEEIADEDDRTIIGTIPPQPLLVEFANQQQAFESSAVTFTIHTADGTPLADDFPLPLRLANDGGVDFSALSFITNTTNQFIPATAPLAGETLDMVVMFPRGESRLVGTLIADNDNTTQPSSTLTATLLYGAKNSDSIIVADDDPEFIIGLETTQGKLFSPGERIVFTIATADGRAVAKEEPIYLNITQSGNALFTDPPRDVTILEGQNQTRFVLNTRPDASRTLITAEIIVNTDLGGVLTPYRLGVPSVATAKVQIAPELKIVVDKAHRHEGGDSIYTVFAADGKKFGQDLLVNFDAANLPIAGDEGEFILSPVTIIHPGGSFVLEETEVLQGQFSATLPAAASSATIIVRDDQDSMFEETGKVSVRIEAGDNYFPSPSNNTVETRIYDDDPPLRLTANTSTAVPSDSIEFTIVAEVPSSAVLFDKTVLVDFSSSYGLLMTTPPSNVTLPRGSNTTSFNLRIRPSSPRGLVTGRIVTKTDNNAPFTEYRLAEGQDSDGDGEVVVVVDSTPALQVTPPLTRRYEEGVSEFIVSTTDGKPLDADIDVSFEVGTGRTSVPILVEYPNGNATSNYTLTSQNSAVNLTARLPAGQTQFVFVMRDDIFPDIEDQFPANMTFTLNPIFNIGADYVVSSTHAVAYATVIDNDPELVLEANTTLIMPGEPIEFTIYTKDGRPVDEFNILQFRYANTDGIINATQQLPGNWVLGGRRNSTSFGIETNVGGLGGEPARKFTATLLVDDPNNDPFTPYRTAPGLGTEEIYVWDGTASYFSVSDATATEGSDSHLEFVVTLSQAIAKTATFDYSVVGETAILGEDFGGSPSQGAGAVTGTITIPANAPGPFVVRVPIINDSRYEDEETISITISDPTPPTVAVIQQARAIGRIIDNDDPPLASVVDMAVSEGTAQAVVMVTLTNPSDRPVQFVYTTSGGAAGDGLATAGEDYIAQSGNVTIAPGETSYPIAIDILDDTVSEPQQRFTLTITDMVGGSFVGGDTNATALITIIDNEALPLVALQAENNGSEGGKISPRFGVLFPAHEYPALIARGTIGGGTATIGRDYTSNGTFTVNLGIAGLGDNPFDTPVFYDIPVINDAADEDNETLQVTLVAVENGRVDTGRNRLEFVITDDDDPPSISVIPPDAAVPEGSDALFTLRLSARSSKPVSVRYFVGFGNATSGVDYEATTGTLRFPPDTRQSEVRVRILADSLSEPDEEYGFVLSDPINATIAQQLTIATIANVEGTAVNISPFAREVVEGEGANFTISLTQAQNQEVSVRVQSIATTATAGVDFMPLDSVVRFAAGETEKSMLVATLPDDVDEDREKLFLRLSDLVGGDTIRIDVRDAILKIADSNPPDFTPSYQSEINEGDPLTLTATLTSPWDGDIPLNLYVTTTPDTSASNPATKGSDFEAVSLVSNRTITIPIDATNGSVVLQSVVDDVFEGDETFLININDNDGLTAMPLRTTLVATILDDEAPPILAFNGTTQISQEGNTSSNTMTFPLQLSGPVEETIEVVYRSDAVTATPGVDYATPSGRLLITSGAVAANISVAMFGDTKNEDDETFTLTLVSASSGVVISTSNATATAIISNDDPPPMVLGQNATGNEGGVLEFPVTLSVASGRRVAVDYRTEVGAGNATSDIDFVASSGRLVFESGEVSKTIQVPLLADVMNEGNETFTLTLVAAENATLATRQVIGTIIDMPVPSVSASSPQVVEGGVLEFNISLSYPWGEEISVEYATADRTAVAERDYTPASGRLVFPANSNASQQVLVTTIGDDLDEGSNETLLLVLSLAANAVIGSNGTGVIVDDDDPPELTISGGSTVEGQMARFRILAPKTRPTQNMTIAVMIAASNSTNTSEVGRREVVMLAGSREVWVEVATNDNNVTAPNPPIETSLLAGAGYMLGVPSSALVVVQDDEASSDIANRASRILIPQIASQIVRRTNQVISDRIFGVFQRGDTFGGVNPPSPFQSQAQSAGVTIQGQTPLGFVAAQARANDAEQPWDNNDNTVRDTLPEIYDLAFSLPVMRRNLNGNTNGDGGDGNSMRPIMWIWGQGYYAETEGEQNGLRYEGELPGGIIGFDVRVNPRTMLGFGISHTKAEFAFATSNTSTSERGNHTSDITTYHPYFGVKLANGASVWGTAGFGGGETRITSINDETGAEMAIDSEVDLRLVGIGFHSALREMHNGRTGRNGEGEGMTGVSATGEVAHAEIDIAAATDATSGGRLDAQSATTGYVRFGFLFSRSRRYANGISTQELETTLRYDYGESEGGGNTGGDGVNDGLGFEVRGKIARAFTNSLKLDLSVRALVTHDNDLQDWGVSGGFRWVSEKGQGLSLSFVPNWGNSQSRRLDIWRGGLRQLVASSDGDSGGRYVLDVRYGIPMFGGRGMLTPFAVRDADGNVQLGSDFVFGTHFSAGYEWLLPKAQGEANDNRLFFRYGRDF